MQPPWLGLIYTILVPSLSLHTCTQTVHMVHQSYEAVMENNGQRGHSNQSVATQPHRQEATMSQYKQI